MQPKVSVILPSLNVSSYIDECVTSVMRQTLKDIEIICVDAGSTDGTLEAIRRYEQEDPRIRVIVADKKSYGLQMNLGLDAASGKYLAIVETDDWIPPTMLERLYTLAEREQLDFVKSDFYRFKVNPDGTLRKDYNRLSWDDSFYNRVLRPSEEQAVFRFIMNTWCGLYNLDFLRKWDIRHHESPGAAFQDNGFWFQTFCRANRAYFLDEPFYMNRRDNPNSSVYDSSKVYAMKEEYDHIRSLLEANSSTLGEFIPLCTYFRFCAYYYNTIPRIAEERLSEFVYFFSDEFLELSARGELDATQFTAHEWRILQRIMYAPEKYIAEVIGERHRFVPSSTSFSYDSDQANERAISVIVPVYNVEEYLSECLDSILRQSFSDFEVICVNDGSTDSSARILEEYAGRDSRITVIHQPNGGLSKARNHGLSVARGQFVCFVDSDDYLARNALGIMHRTAQESDSDLVVFGFKAVGKVEDKATTAWLATKNPQRNTLFKTFRQEALFEEAGAKPFVWRDLVRRSLLVSHNIWFWEDAPFGEDTIFQFQVFPHAKNITFSKKQLYRYRQNRAGSLMDTHNGNMAKKAAAHTQIIHIIFSIWKCEGLINPLKAPFVKWAINFFYNEFVNIPDETKPKLAAQFLRVFKQFEANSVQHALGAGCQARIEEISRLAYQFQTQEAAPLSRKILLPSPASAAPYFSIIVPVHNMAHSIERTLRSLISQTFESIEVICIDDASTDNTLAVLNELADSDPRIRVIHFETNRTANCARKEGVKAARGEYILFCDGDDTLQAEACFRLHNYLLEDPVDILHFGIEVVSVSADQADIEWVEAHALPYDGHLNGLAIFDACFRGRLFSFSLWGKAFKTTYAQKAFDFVEDKALPRGQDLYAFFILAFFAQSYRGIPQANLYNYYMGAGLDGRHSIPLATFEQFCTLANVAHSIHDFLGTQKALDRYPDVLLSVRSQLFGDCLNKWQNKLESADKAVGFECMLQTWPSWMVADGVARRYWGDQKGAVRAVASPRLRSAPQKQISTIGAYYHRLHGGGAETVFRELARIWLNMGYRVVLITDSDAPYGSVAIPQGAIHHTIPNGGIDHPELYGLRCEALTDIIREENIDALVYHSWNSSLLPWDMLTTKAAGAAFLVHCHSVFSLRIRSGEGYFATQPLSLGLADGIVCLSEADEAFWSHFNGNVHVVANPVEDSISSTPTAPLCSPRLIWVGRFSPEKRPGDAIRVLQLVREIVPDAELLVVGSGETPEDQQMLQTTAEECGVSEAVHFCGFQEDVSPYYMQSSVFLGTSEFEGFPLALFEAQTRGIPSVIYELPHLTSWTDGNQGIVQVPFGDVAQMARRTVELLADEGIRERAGNAARAMALRFDDYDFERTWTHIFSSLAEEHPAPELSQAEKLMWTVLLDHCEYGIGKARHEAEEACQAELEVLRTDFGNVTGSLSFRTGRMITLLPRKIRTVIKLFRAGGLRSVTEVAREKASW